jgi:hypothetical protein
VRLVEEPHLLPEAHLIGGPELSATSVITTASGSARSSRVIARATDVATGPRAPRRPESPPLRERHHEAHGGNDLANPSEYATNHRLGSRFVIEHQRSCRRTGRRVAERERGDVPVDDASTLADRIDGGEYVSVAAGCAESLLQLGLR